MATKFLWFYVYIVGNIIITIFLFYLFYSIFINKIHIPFISPFSPFKSSYLPPSLTLIIFMGDSNYTYTQIFHIWMSLQIIFDISLLCVTDFALYYSKFIINSEIVWLLLLLNGRFLNNLLLMNNQMRIFLTAQTGFISSTKSFYLPYRYLKGEARL